MFQYREKGKPCIIMLAFFALEYFAAMYQSGFKRFAS